MINKLGIILFIITCTACSSSKWVVENQFEVDRNDFELIDSKQILNHIGTVSPENPIIQYEILTANTFKYTQRVRTDRYIQRYSPSPVGLAVPKGFIFKNVDKVIKLATP